MLKTKKTAWALLVTLILMLLMPFALSVKTSATFNSNFDIKWTKDGGMNVTQGSKNMNDSFSKIIDKYKNVITFVSAIGAVTMVGVFIFNFAKLGTTSGNPSERSKVTHALIWSGLAAAGLGSVALIVGVFYGMLA